MDYHTPFLSRPHRRRPLYTYNPYARFRTAYHDLDEELYYNYPYSYKRPKYGYHDWRDDPEPWNYDLPHLEYPEYLGRRNLCLWEKPYDCQVPYKTFKHLRK